MCGELSTIVLWICWNVPVYRIPGRRLRTEVITTMNNSLRKTLRLSLPLIGAAAFAAIMVNDYNAHGQFAASTAGAFGFSIATFAIFWWIERDN